MIAQRLLEGCPESVSEVLGELQRDFATESIWLVGSRANQSATAESDWDFLVFSNVDPELASARRPGVDVLLVGPGGHVLLEGKDNDYAFAFDEMQWTDLDGSSATYIGKTFLCDEESERNAEEPVFKRPRQSAFLIWSNGVLRKTPTTT